MSNRLSYHWRLSRKGVETVIVRSALARRDNLVRSTFAFTAIVILGWNVSFRPRISSVLRLQRDSRFALKCAREWQEKKRSPENDRIKQRAPKNDHCWLISTTDKKRKAPRNPRVRRAFPYMKITYSYASNLRYWLHECCSALSNEY